MSKIEERKTEKEIALKLNSVYPYIDEHKEEAI